MHEIANIKAKTSEAKRENTVSRARKPDFSKSLNSPVDHILHLHRTIGNQVVHGLIKKSGAGIQAKLTRELTKEA